MRKEKLFKILNEITPIHAYFNPTMMVQLQGMYRYNTTCVTRIFYMYT